jgi:hypothetical protein
VIKQKKTAHARRVSTALDLMRPNTKEIRIRGDMQPWRVNPVEATHTRTLHGHQGRRGHIGFGRSARARRLLFGLFHKRLRTKDSLVRHMRCQCVSPVEVNNREEEATAASGQLEYKEGVLVLAKRLFPTFCDVRRDRQSDRGEGNTRNLGREPPRTRIYT